MYVHATIKIGKEHYNSHNTVTINVLYNDRVEDNAFSLHYLCDHNTRTSAPGGHEILLDPYLSLLLYT